MTVAVFRSLIALSYSLNSSTLVTSSISVRVSIFWPLVTVSLSDSVISVVLSSSLNSSIFVTSSISVTVSSFGLLL